MGKNKKKIKQNKFIYIKFTIYFNHIFAKKH